MTEVRHAELELEPTVLATRRIGAWLSGALDHLDPRTLAVLFPRAELAIHEACMNVVEHGDLPDGAKIALSLTATTHRLEVRVTDPGAAFDPASAAVGGGHPLQERGYGIKIIRSVADELEYRRIGERNELTLRIEIGGDDEQR